jgi:hypothetical protein
MPIADLIMPKLGESIMEATILKWHKKVGDHVKLDETVLDIATDKVDSEVPSTVAGVITEILFKQVLFRPKLLLQFKIPKKFKRQLPRINKNQILPMKYHILLNQQPLKNCLSQLQIVFTRLWY